MNSFILALVALIAGYFLYSQFVERCFGIDTERLTPAMERADGVDYVVLPWYKIFLIQFLNIAGLGPIFGAILGALYGPVAFIWIVFGCIFAGSVHDYFSGMMSVRHQGQSIPEIVGFYLGPRVCQFMRLLSVVLLLLVGTVFMVGPASLLSNLGFTGVFADKTFWLMVILAYYFLATILPISIKLLPVFTLFLPLPCCSWRLVLVACWSSKGSLFRKSEHLLRILMDSLSGPCSVSQLPAGQSVVFMQPSRH